MDETPRPVDAATQALDAALSELQSLGNADPDIRAAIEAYASLEEGMQIVTDYERLLAYTPTVATTTSSGDVTL